MFSLKSSMEMQSTLYTHSQKEFPQIFSHTEFDKILKSILNSSKYRKDTVGEWIRIRNYTMIRLCYELMLRPKEACMIKLTDIDFQNGTIKISSKSNKVRQGRILPIPTALNEALSKYLAFPRVQFWKFSDYLFPSLKNDHISRDRFTEIFRGILKEAGMYREPTRGTHGGYSLYSLRHSKATETYLKTKDPFIVANLLGHKSLESTKVYIHLAQLNKGYLELMRNALS